MSTKTEKKKKSLIPQLFIASLALGLAPWGINGEPHIIGKVKWLWGGAVGMQAMDWFDLLLHGSPWVLLIGAIIVEGKQKFFPSNP